MKKTIFFILCLMSVSSISAQDIYAQGQKKNPTIRLQMTGLSAALSQNIQRNFQSCGWFTLSKSPAANYTLKINNQGAGKLAIRILDSSGRAVEKGSYTHNVSSLKGDWVQHRLVDEVLSRVYSKKSKICASRIAFCGLRNGIKEIYTVDFSGRNLKKITNYRSLSVEPAWSVDNRYLSYTVYGRQNANLVQMDLSTRRHRLLSHFSGLNSGASFHPNGKKYALTLSRDSKVDLFVMPIGGKGGYALTGDNNIEATPSWSPDGNKLCYVSASMGSNGKVSSPRLYMMDLVKKRAGRMFRDGVERVSPDWSRTSNLIAYSKRYGRQYVLAVCDPANPSSEKILVKDAGDWEAPSWAPDGRHLVCSRNLNGRQTLFVIDTVLKKKKEIRLNSGGKPYFQKMSLPAWSNLD